MANCVKCRFSLNLQLFSVVLKSASVKYTATYFPWDSHQRQSSCTSMSLWWQNNLSLWLSWTISIPKWVSILWHAACAPSDAKLLEGGVSNVKQLLFKICRPFVDRSRANDYVLLMLQWWWKTNIWSLWIPLLPVTIVYVVARERYERYRWWIEAHILVTGVFMHHCSKLVLKQVITAT